jgi:hypothetical protein
MKLLKAHFDGRVLVPDEPVDFPVNCALEIAVRPADSAQQKPLLDLLRELETLPPNTAWPSDGAAQHDHHLYGTDKR